MLLFIFILNFIKNTFVEMGSVDAKIAAAEAVAARNGYSKKRLSYDPK